MDSFFFKLSDGSKSNIIFVNVWKCLLQNSWEKESERNIFLAIRVSKGTSSALCGSQTSVSLLQLSKIFLSLAPVPQYCGCIGISLMPMAALNPHILYKSDCGCPDTGLSDETGQPLTAISCILHMNYQVSRNILKQLKLILELPTQCGLAAPQNPVHKEYLCQWGHKSFSRTTASNI